MKGDLGFLSRRNRLIADSLYHTEIKVNVLCFKE